MGYITVTSPVGFAAPDSVDPKPLMN